ncbi:hypothetical protein, partial [Treponema sp. R6D11]
IIPVFFLFFSCATQFFIRENIVTDKGPDRKKELSQIIIISNPPKDQGKLYEIVENYNRQTITYTEIMKYDVHRSFYKETRYLTRNFEEGKPYPTSLGEFIYGEKQRIMAHSRAHLLWTYNFTNISGQHYFYITDPDVNTVLKRKIDNLEEYYLSP